MADTSAEPSMEDILSSIKRIIAEEGDGSTPRVRRGPIRAMPTPPNVEQDPEQDPEQDEVLELSDPIAPATPDPLPARTTVPPRRAILSDTTAEATRGALDALSRLVVKPEPGADGTLEGLVRDMLRPMLSDWLDANLPAMVETLVAKEITRITNEMR